MLPTRRAVEAAREIPVTRVSMRELAVDFFGSLVPGLVFILGSLATLGWAMLSAVLVFTYSATRDSGTSPFKMIAGVEKLVGPFQLEGFLLLVMLSYVVGHSFFRQDPKEPDRASFLRLYPPGRKETEAELRRWVAQSVEECEFPYARLKTYLEDRKLDHLARMVDWGAEPSSGRTKNFVNILKIRLGFYFPEHCGSIARNEAHVRLMSSTWYMARVLRWASLAAFLVAGASTVAALRLGTNLHEPVLFSSIAGATVFALTIFGVCLLTTRHVERFLHYQRVREVVWVLETAYTAFADMPERLRDICPRYEPPGRPRRRKVKLAALQAQPEPGNEAS